MTTHPTFASSALAAVAGLLLLGLLAPGPRGGAVVPEEPRSVQLPSGVVVPVRAVTTGRDGQLAVPEDARTAGWWQGGSRVGDSSGKTLLAAHIDSPRRGLGPYAELFHARPGLRVVLRSSGLRQVFRIRSVRLVRRESLADHPDLYSPRGPRRLVLVTCAPPYQPRRGGYQNLAVITAAPSGPPTPRSSR
jgi:hypothetical protein